MNQVHTWELEWRPETTLQPGALIELRSLSLRTFIIWQYLSIEMDHADITFRRRANPLAAEVFSLKGRWVIARARLTYGLNDGQSLRIRIRATPPCIAGLYDLLTIWTAPAPTGRDSESQEPEFTPNPRAQTVLNVTAGSSDRLAVYSHPVPSAAGTVRTLLAPQDRYGNPARFSRELTVKLHWNGRRWKETVQSTRALDLPAPEGVGRLEVTVPLADLAAAENITNGRRDSAHVTITGNPVWSAPPAGLRAVFGEFHWHTELSADGSGSIEDALLYARDELNMNYAIASDHHPSPAQWLHSVEVHERFNRPDAFVTLFGYENSTPVGHENYYFTNPRHAVAPTSIAERGVPLSRKIPALHAQLTPFHTENDRFLAIPHHTNAVAETRRVSDDTPYWLAYPWTSPAVYHRNVEVFQTRGNQERDLYPGDVWRGWHSNGASVQAALAHGYKLGFTGGTDNHSSRPGRCYASFESHGRIPTHSISLTGLWAKAVDRDAVFDALYRRHSWAVWDTRALVHFTVQGALAGDEITVRSGEQLTAHLRLSAEDALRLIEVVSESRTVWSGSSEALDLERDIPLGPATRSTHFYLRALQRDGGILYSSPVFVQVK